MSDQSVREKSDNNSAGKEHSQNEHAAWGGPMTKLSQDLPKVLPPKEFSEELLDFVRSESEADISPFYEALLNGDLSKEQLVMWVKQFYYDVRGFPPLVAQMVANCPYQYDVRQMYGVNLAEELGEFKPQAEHPRLLLKLSRALGVPDEEMDFVKPIPEVMVYVEYRHKQVKDGNFLEGISAGALGNEGTIVRRYKKIIKCLKDKYKVPEDSLEFFYIHSGGKSEMDYGGDVAHAQEALDIITKYANTAELQEMCRQAAWRSIESRKMYQWGLYRHVVLQGNYSLAKAS